MNKKHEVGQEPLSHIFHLIKKKQHSHLFHFGCFPWRRKGKTLNYSFFEVND